MALFHASEETSDSSERARLLERADEMLQRALVRFPGVLLPLLDKCSVDADKVARHKYFVDCQIG